MFLMQYTCTHTAASTGPMPNPALVLTDTRLPALCVSTQQ